MWLFVISAVFCLYKSFISLEIIEGIDPSRFAALSAKNRGNVAARIELTNQEELSSSYDELSEAKKQLKLLEMKIQTLENRLSKTYPDVLFLNYKNRKRILVSGKQKCGFVSTIFGTINNCVCYR